MKNLLPILMVSLSLNTSISQCLIESKTGLIKMEHFDSTGDISFDLQVVKEVKQVLNVFHLKSVDMYFNNVDNAFAYNTPGIKTIILGLGLRNRFLQEFGQDEFTAFVAVIAHELAHVKQYSTKGIESLESFQKELHADFLSGYYIGYLQNIELASEASVQVFFETFYGLGDRNYFSNDHHGTNAQRQKATIEGWKIGRYLHSIDHAYMEGIKIVLKIKNLGKGN